MGSYLLNKKNFRWFLGLILILTLFSLFYFPQKTLASDEEELARFAKPASTNVPPYTRENYSQMIKGNAAIENVVKIQSPANYLIKRQGYPNVYFYDTNLNRVRWIDSPQTFENWDFNWANIWDAPSIIYTEGTALRKSPELVKGTSSQIFNIDNYASANEIRLVPSMTIFNNYGFSAANVTQLDDLLMHDYFSYNLSTTPNAQLEKLAASPIIWLYLPSVDNWRYQIPNETAFNNWGFHWSDVQTVGALSGSSGGVSLPDRPIIVKNATENYIYVAIPEVFEVDILADFYLISNEASFNNWHFNWSNIQTIDYGRRIDYTEGDLEASPHLVTVDGGAQVYLLNDDLMWAYPVPNESTFNNWGFNWASITNITGVVFATYTNDSNMPLPYTPYLIKEEGSPYILLAMPELNSVSETYLIANETRFNNWHFNWNGISVVPSYVLFETYNEYAPMSDPVAGS